MEITPDILSTLMSSLIKDISERKGTPVPSSTHAEVSAQLAKEEIFYFTNCEIKPYSIRKYVYGEAPVHCEEWAHTLVIKTQEGFERFILTHNETTEIVNILIQEGEDPGNFSPSLLNKEPEVQEPEAQEPDGITERITIVPATSDHGKTIFHDHMESCPGDELVPPETFERIGPRVGQMECQAFGSDTVGTINIRNYIYGELPKHRPEWKYMCVIRTEDGFDHVALSEEQAQRMIDNFITVQEARDHLEKKS